MATDLSGAQPKGLRQTQSLFVHLLGLLILYAYSKGYEFTLGEGYRPDHHGHMNNSNHYIQLAQDLNLFVKGEWKDKACAEWDDLGTYWKSLHPLCRWGGDFMKRNFLTGKEEPQGDYNHFSLEWDGIK